MALKKLTQWIVLRTLKPIVFRYLSVERDYHYRDIHIKVKPGVFHPGFFFSTRLLLQYLDRIELNQKRFLELGAGSGIISIYAARKGAIVTASDISQTAVKNIAQNVKVNNAAISIYQSDLFKNLPPQSFDVIVINPPYYPQQPSQESQYAWFCGEQFEYFQRLFPEMKPYLHEHTRIIMVLSEVCEIGKIRQFATDNGYAMRLALKKRIWWEMNFIYEIGLRGLHTLK